MRAWLACAAALASLVALVASRMPSEGGGSGGDGRGLILYDLDGPAWVRYALVAIALGLLLAVGLLWAARHRAMLIAALVAIPLLVVGGVFVEIARSHAGHVSNAEAKAVRVGMSEDELQRRLGDPAGHGTWQRRGRTLSCKVYQGTAYTTFVFCFDDGRVVRVLS